MEQSFTPDIIDALRAAIRDADGNEVFFLGHTDEERVVVEVEVLARGHQGAVAAVLQPCRYGDVIIHNHPSGVLEPSDADLAIASRMGSLGVGCYIIDNDASAVYRVVEPFRRIERARLEPEGIAAVLGPGGAVAQRLPGYEDRPEQLRMAFTVGEALNTDGLAVIEAGTGTGKSLAYLVPAILWAKENEERVVVSTNTINLQEQLIRKDIPFLQRAAGLEFRAVLVKGRGNYLCRRRLEAAGSEPGLFEDEKSGELAAIRAWAENAADGSRDDLSFSPHAEVWDEVCSEADQCGRAKCPDYGRCFFHRARRQAAQADVLVVNHALLLTDLALRLQTDNYTAAAVLPPYDRVILDEAHHLEDAATSHFSGQTTRFAFARVLGRLRHPRKPDQGLLARLLKQLGDELPDSFDELYRDLHGRLDGLSGGCQALFDRAVQTLEWAGETLARAVGETVAERRGGGKSGRWWRRGCGSWRRPPTSWPPTCGGCCAAARTCPNRCRTVSPRRCSTWAPWAGGCCSSPKRCGSSCCPTTIVAPGSRSPSAVPAGGGCSSPGCAARRWRWPTASTVACSAASARW